MHATFEPDVTVVIPAYRAERFIDRAIESVLTHPEINPEIVVVVDGIFDRTPEIAGRYANTTVLINRINQGACAARNRGLEVARAPYVMFLDADDWIESPLLSSLSETLRLTGAELGLGRSDRIEENGRRFEAYRPKILANQKLYRLELIAGDFVPTCSTLWNREFLSSIGGWKLGLRRNQDYELVIRATLLGAGAAVSLQGTGVFSVWSSNHRISCDNSVETSRDRINIIRMLVRLAEERGHLDEVTLIAFRRATYRLLRSLSRHVDAEPYWEADEFWRQLGGSGHYGSLLHRLFASIIGLRRKEMLAVATARLRVGSLKPQ